MKLTKRLIVKRLIVFISITILILSSYNIVCGMELADPSKTYEEVPDGTALVNKDGYRLNLTLFWDKKLIYKLYT